MKTVVGKVGSFTMSNYSFNTALKLKNICSQNRGKLIFEVVQMRTCLLTHGPCAHLLAYLVFSYQKSTS